jgi:hypothetical protein
LCPGSGVQRAILLFGEFSPRLAVLDGEITETGIATAEKLGKNNCIFPLDMEIQLCYSVTNS